MSKYYFTIIIMTVIFFMVGGCATKSKSVAENEQFETRQVEFKGSHDMPREIFVFFDGTRNTANSKTNVWRLFELIDKNADTQKVAIYIEGVGTTMTAPISGTALGREMELRILRGYKFITQNYRQGDQIYIFGFSRGAHQARSLAGLVSYTGIPKISDNENESLIKIGNSIIELLKKKSDEDYLEQWQSWQPDQEPLLGAEIKAKLNYDMQSAGIAFLGLWDTVPGSSLKRYGECKEEKGFFKKYLYWLIPGVDKGNRYKTDSYPPIQHIAHAVAIDEKRSKFKPLIICKQISQQYTDIEEVWFPGAHADVGGGYADSKELPLISLAWMLELLKESYAGKISYQVEGDPKGLAHWSIGDFPGNLGSECIDRLIPEGAVIHPSFYTRKIVAPVPIRWEGEVMQLDYPIDCSAYTK